MVAQEILGAVGPALQQVEEDLRAALNDGSEATRPITLHLLDSGGKRVRPIMCLLSANVFPGGPAAAVPVAVAAELIHMATLIHDDVIDQATTRRGRATVNHRWGNNAAVLAGDCLLAKALVVLVDHSTPAVIRIMSDMIYRMCEGEIHQNLTLRNVDQNENDYFERIEKKTALFFGACCEAGGLVSGATLQEARALGAYGRHLGMTFQIVDDLLDVAGDPAAVGKPVGKDLSAGILTLPVIYLLKHPDYRRRIASILERSELSPADVEHVLQLVHHNGALEYARRVAGDFARRARLALDAVPAGRGRDLLMAVADYSLQRSA